jgi:protein-disulfide isomerase
MERAAVAPPIGADRLASVRPAEWIDPAKSLGPADAAVTVIIFADFLCPACRGALGSLLQYQNAHPNDVRVVYRHLPLWEIRGHESSKAAAALSEMAGEQGKFWTFAHALHSQRGQMNWTEYLELMRKLGFEPAAVEARLDDSTDRAIQNVQRDIAFAGRLGIRATPIFIVQIGTYAPASATERGLARILNSTTVVSLLAERHQLRVAQR